MRLDIKKIFVGVVAGILSATMVACTPAATDNTDVTEEETTTEVTVIDTTEVTVLETTEVSSNVEEDTTEEDTSTSEEPTITDVEETTVAE